MASVSVMSCEASVRLLVQLTSTPARVAAMTGPWAVPCTGGRLRRSELRLP